jgi:hypothetical protein
VQVRERASPTQAATKYSIQTGTNNEAPNKKLPQIIDMGVFGITKTINKKMNVFPLKLLKSH